jgi:hypothetical protein
MHTTLGSKTMRRTAALAAIILAAATGLAGCTSTQRNFTAPSYLIVESIQAAAGNDPSKFSGSLGSDVLTNNVRYEDPGQVVLRVAMVDPVTLTGPTSTNFITVTRYRVHYVRSDGKAVQGVDVPFDFEGSGSMTIGVAVGTLPITLVRAQAKGVAPLSGLIDTNGHILTTAEVTIFGADQAGNAVQVVAYISVDFSDWKDPS